MNDNREVEYFLPEEECTHTPDLRDKGVETGYGVWREQKATPSGRKARTRAIAQE